MRWWSLLPGVLGVCICLFGILAGVLLRSFTHFFVIGHLGVGLLLLVSAYPSWKRRRRQHSGMRPGRKLLSDSIPAVVGLVFTLIALNVWVAGHNVRIDTTAKQVHQLSHDLSSLLATMPGELKLFVVKIPGVGHQEKTYHLLERLQAEGSGRVSVTMLSPIQDAPRLSPLGLRSGNILSMHYEDAAGKRTASLATVDEEAVYNELRALVNPEKRTIYMVQGHGEPGLSDKSVEGFLALKTVLQEHDISIKPLILSHLNRLPEDMDALIIPAQEQGLLPQEEDLLREYIQGGGRAYIALDPMAAPFYFSLVEDLGVSLHQGVVLDRANDSDSSSDVAWNIVASPADGHPLLRGFSGDDGVSVVFSLSFSVSKEQKEGRQVSPLLVTSKDAWLETDVAALLADSPTASFDEEKDIRGPLPLFLAIDTREGQRQLVSGDVDWMRNGNMAAYHNKAFAERLIDWLSTSRTHKALPPRTYEASRVLIDATTYHFILVLSFLVPEFLLLLGLYAWWRRRWWEPHEEAFARP